MIAAMTLDWLRPSNAFRPVNISKSIAPNGKVWLHPCGCQRESLFVSRKLASCGTLVAVNDVIRRCIHVFYSGTVQGVGFRYSVKSLSTGFEVTGVVGNLPDGRVELVAEGAKNELEAFTKAIRESELGHFIRKEDMRWDQPSNVFRGFEIVR